MSIYTKLLESSKVEGRNYRTDELVIFSVGRVEELNKANAKSHKLKDGKYCMIGYYNKDKTKFKDVITGEIYENIKNVCFSHFDEICEKRFFCNNDVYAESKIVNEKGKGIIKISSYHEGNLLSNLEFTKDDSIFNLLLKLMEKSNYIDVGSIKWVVKVLNKKMDNYIDLLIEQNKKDIDYQKALKRALKDATLTDEERDF